MSIELNLVQVPKTHFLFSHSNFVPANLKMKVENVSLINIFLSDDTYMMLHPENDSFLFPNFSLHVWQLHEIEQYDTLIMKNISQATDEEDMPLHKIMFLYDEIMYRNHYFAEQYFQLYMNHACIVRNMIHK